MEDFNKPSTLSFKHFNKPSILSFKHYDIKVSIKVDMSGLTIGDFYENCKQLALAVGYAPKTVNEYFTEEQ